jgi:phosphatidylglycerophosphatase A
MNAFKSMCRFLCSVGPLGYLWASGSMASVCAVPFIYYVYQMLPHAGWLFLIVLSLLAFFAITYAQFDPIREPDPAWVVIDEVVGIAFTFYGLSLNVPMLFCGLLLFRFFDITKVGGISWLEKLKGSSGILLDDIAAGIFANMCLRMLSYML